MKILCFGSCNIDFVYSVDHIVNPGETVAADVLSIFPGGKGLNQAVALGKSGAEVYFAGCIGTDGDFLKDVLVDAGVNIQHLKTVGEKTGHAIIQVDRSAENSIVIFPGANGCVAEEQINDVLMNFNSGDILLIQNEINNLPYLVRSAEKIGMQIFFNPSPLNDQIRLIDLALIRCLLVNESESEKLIGSKIPENIQDYIKKKYPNLEIVLTLGKQGSVHITSEHIIRQDAYKVDCIDTTAAGDSYTGYYLSGISKGESIKKAMDRASIASAIAVSRKGAAVSIPICDEVDRFIRKR